MVKHILKNKITFKLWSDICLGRSSLFRDALRFGSLLELGFDDGPGLKLNSLGCRVRSQVRWGWDCLGNTRSCLCHWKERFQLKKGNHRPSFLYERIRGRKQRHLNSDILLLLLYYFIPGVKLWNTNGHKSRQFLLTEM